jgi:hypothetical protein
MKDADAVEIGKLFRMAKDGDWRPVTATRNFSEKVSPSRNADWFHGLSRNGILKVDPDAFKANARACHFCRNTFAADQTHYPIMTDVENIGIGWTLASVCMACFKVASDDEIGPQKRFQRDCRGCGAPMLTPLHGPYAKEVCSPRCYQRDYRKRRRGRNSVVAWKARRPNTNCKVCKKSLDQWGQQHKRKDSVYCSPKCRQWAYRRRKP